MFVLIGSGPGIGSTTAALFAAKKFDKIVLISRNAERLEDEKKIVIDKAKQAGRDVEVKTFAVDIADAKALHGALSEVRKIGEIEVLLFNAARVQPSPMFETSSETILTDFKITNIALYETARTVIPDLQKAAGKSSGSPSFFVTGGMVYKDPVPPLFSLSMTKTSQRNFVQCLHMTYGKEIHVGQITIGGEVKPEKSHMSPNFIAERFWELYEQPREKWAFEIEVPEK